MVVEGRYRESPRKNYLVPEVKEAMEKGGAAGCPCPLCRLGLFVQHTVRSLVSGSFTLALLSGLKLIACIAGRPDPPAICGLEGKVNS